MIIKCKLGGATLPFSYKPLWKLLIDKELSKKKLMDETGISKSTIVKMVHGEQVSMDILDRLCNFLECDIEEIIEHY